MAECDVLIIGAGAAGLAAGIFAARAATGKRIVVLEGARKPGAKILVSGGGRCNVTNERVSPDDYWGGPRPMVRSVLRAFDENRTIEWMREIGVELKLEPTGKYFPTTDSARTVLDALLTELNRSGAELISGARVESVSHRDGVFTVGVRDAEEWQARKLILATGGMSLPKSGSDGWGLGLARRFGHTITRTTPALSPLMLMGGGRAFPFAELSGITVEARLEVRRGTGKPIHSSVGSTLFTHFGLSGPAPLDASRHLLQARLEAGDSPVELYLGHPKLADREAADRWLMRGAEVNPRCPASLLIREIWPERMARSLVWMGGDFDISPAQMPRDERRALSARLSGVRLDCSGDRGYSFAETTAGGVDLREVDTRTMESRVLPGLHLAGEMLDVDGRIGGFNFQWAWATGFLAGRAATA